MTHNSDYDPGDKGPARDPADIFAEALDLPEDERGAYLDKLCEGDAALRAHVETLLVALTQAEDAFQTQALHEQLRVAARSATGEADSGDHVLDHYQLLDRIGSGGMGEVWRAEQHTPVRRIVAIKVIKAGMDSGEIIARFEAERQALALMDHPSIAKILDAGTTQGGRPFFAMEYVDGVTITEYCDRNRLDTRARLRLFQRVCDAVLHAHQKAILHRDLKPGNILVTEVDGEPQPKVIDFGIAKATAQPLTDRTMQTMLGQLLGTPEYMSPEQADVTGEDIDTRTDVYSLGVVLYELLAGALPFESGELRKAGLEGIVRMIREQDPPKPSTRLSTLNETNTAIAEKRGSRPGRLASDLRGDLDWIVMRCLEKDRERRYGSPQELAQDIERHLSDEPVIAGPPSARYRARKFVRRNRTGVVAASTAVVVLIAFLAMTLVQSQRIADQRDRANREAAAARRISEFQADMLASVEPSRFGENVFAIVRANIEGKRGVPGITDAEVDRALADFDQSTRMIFPAPVARGVFYRGVLERASGTIESELASDPLIAADLHHTLAVTYNELTMRRFARAEAERAMELRQEHLGPDHPFSLESQQLWAELHGSKQRRPILREVLVRRAKVLGPDHPETLATMVALADALHSQEVWVEGDSLARVALPRLIAAAGEDDPRTARAYYTRADLAFHMERFDEADSLFALADERVVEAFGKTSFEYEKLLTKYATHLRYLKRYDENAAVRRELLELHEERLGSRHIWTLQSMWGLSDALIDIGQYGEAEAVALSLLETSRDLLGPYHLYVRDALAYLIDIERRTGPSERLPRYQEELAQALRYLLEEVERDGADYITLNDLAWGMTLTGGRIDPAVPVRLAEQAVGMVGEDNADVSPLMGTLAEAHYQAGDRDKAFATARRAIELDRHGIWAATIRKELTWFDE